MAKLNTEQLINLLEYTLNSDVLVDNAISSNQVDKFTDVYEGASDSPLYMLGFVQLASELDFDFDKIRLKLTKPDKPLTAGSMEVPLPERVKSKKFVITSAQNNTETHSLFFKALKSYCKKMGSDLLIGKFTYNKNGFQNDQTTDDGLYYSPELSNYLFDSHIKLCDTLEFFGNINILPTAKNPLIGFEGLTKNSFILPHAKISMESYCTSKNKAAKLGYTTGTVTLKNYVQKKAGQTAQKAHCYGALVVEIDSNNNFFVRQIQTDETGIFQDLKTVYYPDGSTKSGTIAAINWGDIHAEKSDLNVLASCERMLDYFRPKNQVFHDLFDFEARNHHNRKSGHFLAKQFCGGNDSVYENIKDAHSVLGGFNRSYSTNYIVESNHDLALQAWLDANDYNFKLDPVNALCYLELQEYVYKELAEGKEPELLKFALSGYIDKKLKNTVFLKTDESLLLKNIEMGVHGHIGDSGSRGTPQQLQKRGEKMNTGHTHSASIKNNVYTAGVTGSLDMGYNKGGSSWSHSHILTYGTGERAIITMQGSNWGFIA